MIICKALLKYGYSNFSLEILEYCESKDCKEREQYFLEYLKPKYNILKFAYSLLGFKHSYINRAKLSETNKGKTILDETRAKLSEANKGEKIPIFNKIRAK
jgi:group I intron endonuclease